MRRMSGKQESVVDVQGTVEDGFEPVRDAFMANFARRGERGAAVAVYRHGHKVVDLWGGTKDGDADPDAADTAPWEAGTAQVIRSATKGIAAPSRCCCTSADSSTWTRRSARTGPSSRPPARNAYSSAICSRTAPDCPSWTPRSPRSRPSTASAAPPPSPPRHPPGSPAPTHGYHAQTYSWLLGELVLRVTGRTLGSWIAEEIAGPLGLDLWIGLPRGGAVPRRTAGRPSRTPAPPAATGLRVRPKQPSPTRTPTRTRSPAVPSPRSRRRPDENDPAYRAAELPASAGIATARSLARCYAALIGSVDDHPRLFAPATLTLARTEESAGLDRTLLVHTRFGLGFMLHGPASPAAGARFLRPPRPRRRAGLRRSGDRAGVRLCHQWDAAECDGGSSGAGAVAGGFPRCRGSPPYLVRCS